MLLEAGLASAPLRTGRGPNAALVPVAGLFPDVVPEVLTKVELLPRRPFVGRLFDLLERAAGEGRDAAGARPPVALVVPVRWLAPGPGPDLVTVADHVNLTLRGPLTGRWPVGRPRTFPATAAIYQPADVRLASGARVYSDIVVAGVADASRLTLFEQQAVEGQRLLAACDCLVAPVVIAAYFGLHVIACGVPTPAGDRERRRNEGEP